MLQGLFGCALAFVRLLERLAQRLRRVRARINNKNSKNRVAAHVHHRGGGTTGGAISAQ
jgi:hypothetical protein